MIKEDAASLVNYIEQGYDKQNSGEEVFFSFTKEEIEYILEALDYYKEPVLH